MHVRDPRPLKGELSTPGSLPLRNIRLLRSCRTSLQKCSLRLSETQSF